MIENNECKTVSDDCYNTRVFVRHSAIDRENLVQLVRLIGKKSQMWQKDRVLYVLAGSMTTVDAERFKYDTFGD